jgi:hypothetical protein
MPEENEGAAYLLSLKRAKAPAGMGAAVGGASTEPAAVEMQSRTFSGVALPGTAVAGSALSGVQRQKPSGEKRRSPRYRCQGSVRLQPTGGMASIWATCTDISLQGCYVEATTPYRVGAELAVRIEANNLRVEGIGEVRVCYPGLGMGISFTAMREEDRERLMELIHSLGGGTTAKPRHEPELPVSGQMAAAGVGDPSAALRAMQDFFASRQMMSREAFLSILRKSSVPK